MRIYICHTFYHVYVACLKELNIAREARIKATRGENSQAEAADIAHLMLSRMSNKFGDLGKRAVASGLFQKVFDYDEKPDTFFDELVPLKTDTGNLLHNLFNRIRFTKRLGRLQEQYIPVDLSKYDDIYVFCDSDPIGYYLNYKKIRYHAMEDGLNCIQLGDQARIDNNGHFKLKAALASTGLIFIQNGWSRYCIDMEVNDLSVIDLPCPKYREVPRLPLQEALTGEDKTLLLGIFLENASEIERRIKSDTDRPKVMILSEPLCDPDTRRRIFEDIMKEYVYTAFRDPVVIIKQHPRDYLDYSEAFPDAVILPGTFPMEMLNFMDIHINRLISVFTILDAIRFGDEKIFLGYDFMDRYEAPEIHRLNDQITG